MPQSALWDQPSFYTSRAKARNQGDSEITPTSGGRFWSYRYSQTSSHCQVRNVSRGRMRQLPAVGLSRKGYMEKYGGISAVKGNLGTMMVNALLAQRRKLTPGRGRVCPKATQPVSCSTDTHPTSSSSQPLVAFTWPHWCTVCPTPKARRWPSGGPSALPRQKCQPFMLYKDCW